LCQKISCYFASNYRGLKLKERLEIKEKLNYEYQAYWLDGDGPYCSKCYDKDKNLIRMIDFGGGVTRICPECKLGVDINK
jgi:hypothetical protein